MSKTTTTTGAATAAAMRASAARYRSAAEALYGLGGHVDAGHALEALAADDDGRADDIDPPPQRWLVQLQIDLPAVVSIAVVARDPREAGVKARAVAAGDALDADGRRASDHELGLVPTMIGVGREVGGGGELAEHDERNPDACHGKQIGETGDLQGMFVRVGCGLIHTVGQVRRAVWA